MIGLKGGLITFILLALPPNTISIALIPIELNPFPSHPTYTFLFDPIQRHPVSYQAILYPPLLCMPFNAIPFNTMPSNTKTSHIIPSICNSQMEVTPMEEDEPESVSKDGRGPSRALIGQNESPLSAAGKVMTDAGRASPGGRHLQSTTTVRHCCCRLLWSALCFNCVPAVDPVILRRDQKKAHSLK